MEEVWKDITGFEGMYQISNQGRVKSIPHKISNGKGIVITKEKILKPNTLTKGYFQVTLSDKNAKRHSLQVHRLVAQMFVENSNPELYDQVNHIDGNKQNNVYTNLEWVNNSENQKHAWRIGLQKRHNCGWGTTRLGVKVAVLDNDGNIERVFDTIISAARYVGENTGANVRRVLDSPTWACHGRKFIRL